MRASEKTHVSKPRFDGTLRSTGLPRRRREILDLLDLLHVQRASRPAVRGQPLLAELLRPFLQPIRSSKDRVWIGPS